jgi:hypothetical protein
MKPSPITCRTVDEGGREPEETDMKILNLFATEPDETTRALVRGLSKGRASVRLSWDTPDLDYRDVVRLVFECDRVVCWW